MGEPALTETKIRRVIEGLDDKKSQTMDAYHEFVPCGDFCNFEKLSFIIAAIPGVAGLSEKMIVDMLQVVPNGWNPPDSPLTKPNMIHRWAKKYPAHAHEIAQFCAKDLSVPERIKQNEEWLCIVAFGVALDWAVPRKLSGLGSNPDCMPDRLDEMFMRWKMTISGQWGS